MVTVESGEKFTVAVRGFDDVEDISAVPTRFTPACDGHPLAPFGGPIAVRNARQGDVVAIDPIELTPFGVGKSAILRSFGRAAPRVPGAGSALLAGCATAEPGSAVLEEGFSAGFQLPPQAASASNH